VHRLSSGSSLNRNHCACHPHAQSQWHTPFPVTFAVTRSLRLALSKELLALRTTGTVSNTSS
jgi:hypothetical protein